MIRFKCNGQPYIDPWHKFTIDDWEPFNTTKEGERKTQIDVYRPIIIGSYGHAGFKIKPGQPINTSVFEEAEVVEP
jgi:hypothetical protein